MECATPTKMPWTAGSPPSGTTAPERPRPRCSSCSRRCPLAAPPAGFADRVLLRAGLQTAGRTDLFAWRPLRIVLALCLAATGFGTLWLPPVLRALAGFLSVERPGAGRRAGDRRRGALAGVRPCAPGTCC